MKKFSKLMAVLLSLVLCIGMVAPAFATNAYFYLEENGQYKFLGQGEMKEDVANGTMSNEAIKDVVTAPESTGGKQTVTGIDQSNGDQSTDVTVDTSTIDTFFQDDKYGDYVYDKSEGTSNVLGSEKTYTVTWTVGNSRVEDGKGAADAAVKDGEVVFTGTPGATKVDFDLYKDTVHFDGKVSTSNNTAVKVVVDNFKEDAVENGGLYVRGGISGDELNAAITQAFDSIVAGLENNNLDAEGVYTITEKGFVKTYTENTYEVTYNASDLLNFAGVGATTYGKVNGHTERGGLDSVYVPGRGTYTFGGWNRVIDPVTGNYTYTAVVNYVPEYVDVGTTIDDVAVPLAAGPVTRAEFVDYLWRHEGEPDSDGVCTFTDVPEDHDYVLALAWAEQNGIIEAYEDGTFEPDELVTVAAVREFLGNFADVFGTNAVAAADLTTLVGEDDEAVLNCDEVLAEFFGEEYVTAEDEAA